MKLNKPNFWSSKLNFFTFLLLPISILTLFYVFLKKKFSKQIKFNIPIICIGNIYIGGTGKTPTSILIAKELLNLKKRPVIVRKFYEDHKDEHDLIKGNFDNLILNKNRVSGIRIAEEKNFNVAILDDGFQEYRIKSSLNIICFNSEQLIGNGFVLPSGPLRESLNALINAHIVLINGEKNIGFEKKILNINKNLKIFYSYYKPINFTNFKNKKFLAISGIGNPENFFKLAEKNHLQIEEKLIFPDHYNFSYNEIKEIIDKAKKKIYKL